MHVDKTIKCVYQIQSPLNITSVFKIGHKKCETLAKSDGGEV